MSISIEHFIQTKLRFTEYIPGEGLFEPEGLVYTAICKYMEAIPSKHWKERLAENCRALGYAVQHLPSGDFRPREIKHKTYVFTSPRYTGPAFSGFRLKIGESA